jgi:predicted transcriptional regulator
MITYLTPDQASALQAGGNAPMQIVDPTTRRVYYVIDSGLLAELERRSDLDAIREGVADMQVGRSVLVDQARTMDRAKYESRFDEYTYTNGTRRSPRF